MNGLQPQLAFQVIYADADLTQLEVHASNGTYAGVTRIYMSADGAPLLKLRRLLTGFPKTVSQVVTYDFGPDLQFTFYCRNRIGHPAVKIIIQETTAEQRATVLAEAQFRLAFEPAQLDEFLLALDQLSARQVNEAVLVGLPNQLVV